MKHKKKIEKHVTEVLKKAEQEMFLSNFSLFKPYQHGGEVLETVFTFPMGVIFGPLTGVTSLTCALVNTVNLGLHAITCRNFEDPKREVRTWLMLAEAGGLMCLSGVLAPVSLVTRTGTCVAHSLRKNKEDNKAATAIGVPTITIEENAVVECQNGISLP